MLRQSVRYGFLTSEPFICSRCQSRKSIWRNCNRLDSLSFRTYSAASTTSASAPHDRNKAVSPPQSGHSQSSSITRTTDKTSALENNARENAHKVKELRQSDLWITPNLPKRVSVKTYKLRMKIRSKSRRGKQSSILGGVKFNQPSTADTTLPAGQDAWAQRFFVQLKNHFQPRKVKVRPSGKTHPSRHNLSNPTSWNKTRGEQNAALKKPPKTAKEADEKVDEENDKDDEDLIRSIMVKPKLTRDASVEESTPVQKFKKNEAAPSKELGKHVAKPMKSFASGRADKALKLEKSEQKAEVRTEANADQTLSERSKNELVNSLDKLLNLKSLKDSRQQNPKVKMLNDSNIKNVVAKSGAKKRAEPETHVKSFNANTLKFQAVDVEKGPVPNLSYGLHRVLFNRGVHVLQDLDTRVYNFDPYLQKPMAVEDFNFNAITPYITSSKDENLISIAKRLGKRYTGSTSSMTATLSQFHFLLSRWRDINTKMLSQEFPAKYKSFTKLSRAPTSVFLRWKDGTYAIDADKQYDYANVLSMLGKSLEKLLTLDKEEYERYRKQSSHQITEEEGHKPESYNYSVCGDMLMRSQLDAWDDRLPGTGMFDLKTRACVAIRMNVKNFKDGMDYEIKSDRGEWESFEREYYDMIRAAMLKYSLQVRMGRMEGIFVAFHNIARIFGFQYISLRDMDQAIHGETDTFLGDQEFKISLKLFNETLNRAAERFPNQSLRLHFETRETTTPFMYIFVEPMTDVEIDRIQDTNAKENADFERNVLGISKNPGERDADWAKYQSEVDKTIAKDAASLGSAIQPESTLGAVEQNDDTFGSQEVNVTENMETEATEMNGIDIEIANNGLQEAEQVTVLEADKSENKVDTVAVESSVTETPQQETEIEFPQNTETLSVTNTTDLTHMPSSADISEPENPNMGSATATRIENPDEELIESQAYINKLANEPSEFMNFSDSTQQSGDSRFLDSVERAMEKDGQLQNKREILAMVLTIRNNINGRATERPHNLLHTDEWVVEYSFLNIEPAARAHILYEACMQRRKQTFSAEAETGFDGESEGDYFLKLIRFQAAKGKAWRKERDSKDRGKPIKMWDGSILPSDSV